MINLDKANEAIGAHMATVRKRKRLSQTDVAESIGLDQSALSRIENGKQSLTAAQWVAFCWFMDAKSDRLTNRILRKIRSDMRVGGVA